MNRNLRLLILFCFSFFIVQNVYSQVSISNNGMPPHPSAMLDVQSHTLGFMLPRLDSLARNSLFAIASGGLLVYDTSYNRLYLHNGSGWERVTGINYLWSSDGYSTYLSNPFQNVGIGTTQASTKLHVSGGDILADRKTVSNSLTRYITIGGARNASGNDYAQINFQNIDENNGNVDYIGARISSQNDGSSDDGDLRFHTSDQFGLTQKMVLTGSGDIGLGTDPSYGIDVYRNTGSFIRVKSNSGFAGYIVDKGDASDNGYIIYRTNGIQQWFLGMIGNNDFTISTTSSSGSDHLYINSSGKIGLGTNTPQKKLSIIGTDDTDAGPIIQFNGTTTDQFESGRIRFVEGSETNFRGAYVHYDGGGNVFHLGVHNTNVATTVDDVNAISIERSSADVGIKTSSPGWDLEVNGSAAKPGGGSWTTSSDARLKRNVSDYTPGLNEVLRIRPVKYQYNELSGYNTDEEFVGVIAQEMQEVAPEMVDSFEREGSEYLSVDNSAMTYMLVNAVKELNNRIETLERENALLKERLVQLSD